jgi:peroxiredoxin
MLRIHRKVLWYALVASAVGCGASEKQAALPVAEPPPEASAEAVAPQATDLAAGAKQAAEETTPQTRIEDPNVKPAAAEQTAQSAPPEARTAFFRLDANAPATIPKVELSKGHEALCKVKVGDVLPAIELPDIGTSQQRKLSDLYGKTATVVVFWTGDRPMTRQLLADLGPDVTELFDDKGVSVVGIAVNETAPHAKAVLDKAGAAFVNLLDASGKAFARVGSARLPRVYVVDRTGKILWFDIEYSQTTRRELHQALHATTGAPPETPAASAKPQAGKVRE